MSNLSSYDLEILRPLEEAAALSLTGMKVTVTHRIPTPRDSAGHAYRTTSGEVRIDLSTSLGEEDLFSTYLHEVGHVFNGDLFVENYGCFDFHLLPSNIGPEHTKADLEAYAETKEEKAADAFSREIGNYAFHKALSVYGNASLKNRLSVLCSITLRR